MLLCLCVYTLEERPLLNTEEIIAAISTLSGPELNRVLKAVEQRSAQLKQSTVAEHRNHGSGILQLEYRTNPKTGTMRDPYWYFHYREGGWTTYSLCWQDRRSRE